MIPLYDTARSRRLPFVTWLLIALNVAIFIYEIGLGQAALEGFIRAWGLVPVRLLRQPEAEWVTLFSHPCSCTGAGCIS